MSNTPHPYPTPEELARKEAEEEKAFQDACRPLIKYLCEHHPPHTTVIVDCTSAQLLEGCRSVQIPDYVRD